MMKMACMMFIVPSVMLLTASFFVLIGISIAQGKWVKTFGWVVAVLLWISAALIFSSGTMMCAGSHDKMMKMKGCMMMEKCGMTGGMHDKMGGMMDEKDGKAKTAGNCIRK